MSTFQSQNHRYDRLFDEDEETPPHEQILMSHDSNKWNQIVNLDDFFTRIYNYHRNNGFWCMFVNDLLQLLQFAFVVFFVVFLSCCVNYDKLGTDDPKISDAVDWSGISRIHGFLALLVIIAIFYWSWRCFKFVYNTIKFKEIKIFYRDVLKISEDNLNNLDWAEVQSKLMESQKSVQLCLHKEHLTELDISNRILRIDNYKVAMINKNVLPYTFTFPLLGQRVFLSKGLMGNLELILFSGPWAPFTRSWELDERYKRRETRELLAQRLDKIICYVALINFLLMPAIFVWQLIFQIVHYAELVKREPGLLGVRIWSLYARHFLRHYNEMDHEFDARLKKAYLPANKYLNLFTSAMLVIIAKNVAFFAGALLFVLVCLTLVNEELLFADNVPLAITVLGVTVSVCKALVPDANTVYCPDVLMKEVLQHTHYQPDSWSNAAHLPHVRQQFSQLFVFKGMYLAEELISPLLTPFILFYNVRHRSLDFVDFLRNYTVNVVGVGDVCSFSQMDIKRHGNPEWMSFGMTSGSQVDHGEHGKTELSLINFSIRNPAWKPNENEAMYISTIKALAKQDGESMGASMAASMTARSMAASMVSPTSHIPSPMLASMGLPHFVPTQHSSSSLDNVPHSSLDNAPHSSSLDSAPHSAGSTLTMLSTDKHTDRQVETEDFLPPTDIPTEMHGTNKKYIFDDQYTQIEQSYRETRQPIRQSVDPVPAGTSQLGGGPVSQLGGGPVSQVPPNSDNYPNSLMHMSTLDVSSQQMFMSASPYMEHSQWAARSSLSQGAEYDGRVQVSWTDIRREYRDMAKSVDLNNSSMYLHSLHSRLKQQTESAEDMMTRSLHSRIRSQQSRDQIQQSRDQQYMSKSYPNPYSSTDQK